MPALTIRLGVPGVFPVPVTRTLTPVALTLGVPTLSLLTEEPSWVPTLRAAFAGYTLGTTYTVPTGAGWTDGHLGAVQAAVASVNINNFIAGKSGSGGVRNKIVFPAGATYTLGGDNQTSSGQGGITIFGMSDLWLYGYGANIVSRTTSVSDYSSTFFLAGSARITIEGFTVDGENTATATSSVVYDEKKNGISIRSGCSFIEIKNCNFDRCWGFGFWTHSDGGGVWPTDVWMHGNTIRGGEMGIAITAVKRQIIENNAIDDSQWMAIDLEPDSSQSYPNGVAGGGGGFQDVYIADNTFDTYGWHETSSNWWIAFVPQDAVVATCTMDRLTVRRNVVTRGPANPLNNGNRDGLGGLGVRADKANVKNDIVFEDNWTSDDNTYAPGVMFFDHVNNLTVRRNTQPLTAGPLIGSDTNPTGTHITTPNP